jgi:hypothetical protein
MKIEIGSPILPMTVGYIERNLSEARPFWGEQRIMNDSTTWKDIDLLSGEAADIDDNSESPRFTG